MEVAGSIVLLATLFASAYLLFWTNKTTSRITVFGSLGIFCGLSLLLATRVTEVEIPIVGSIRAAAQRAETASNEIEALVEDARKRVSELERLSVEAQEGISKLRTNGDFSSLLIRARNGDRAAFSKVAAMSSIQGPLQDVAAGAVVSIIQDVVYGLHFGATVPWDELKIDPSKATLDQFRATYRSQVFPPMRSAVLSEAWEQDRFSKVEKLDFVADVIRDDADIYVVNVACRLMSSEAKLNRNFVAAQEYLDWRKSNRDSYQ